MFERPNRAGAAAATVMAAVLASPALADQLDTAFTYQGKLGDAGDAADGLYDFIFRLWDDPVLGIQQGGDIVLGAIDVEDGLFSVELDFGPEYEQSTALWLEIDVRPAGGGAFTTLAPRQKLNAAPFALGLRLPFHGARNAAGSAFSVVNGSVTGAGVSGEHSGDGAGIGVYGVSHSGGQQAKGVHGLISSTSAGSYSAGVRGENRSTGGGGIGVWGSHDGSGWGVLAESAGGHGLIATSGSGTGAYGSSTSSYGVYGFTTDGPAGVRGQNSSDASSAYGVHGRISSLAPGSYSAGVRGENRGVGGLGIGVWGSHEGSGWGVLGESPSGVGVYGSSVSGYAGYFGGNVTVTGTLAKGGGSFKIDHPLDPTNKYLQHSFVESPDMMNIYNGNVHLDDGGAAVVEMPEWFDALNREFRYQLTAIGGAAPNLHVAREIEDRVFVIAGGAAGMKVSWQVTGIRQDPYARANPIEVEVDKIGDERGTYLHPEAYGVEQASPLQGGDR